jgi:hypothetical protein
MLARRKAVRHDGSGLDETLEAEAPEAHAGVDVTVIDTSRLLVSPSRK